RWLRAHQPVSPAPVVVVRDPASEARLGSGAWDRAVLAGLVSGLSRAGAAVIGLDAPLGQPSAPGRGGASSDALLSQAIALAENVVIPIALAPTALLRGARSRPGRSRWEPGGSVEPPGAASWPQGRAVRRYLDGDRRATTGRAPAPRGRQDRAPPRRAEIRGGSDRRPGAPARPAPRRSL